MRHYISLCPGLCLLVVLFAHGCDRDSVAGDHGASAGATPVAPTPTAPIPVLSCAGLTGAACRSEAFCIETDGDCLPIMGVVPVRDGCSAEPQLVAHVPWPGSRTVALDDRSVYLGIGDRTFAVPKTGGRLTEVPARSLRRTDEARDATHAFAITSDGDLTRKRLDGPGIESIGTFREECMALAVDDTHLYWTNEDSGEVSKARKPQVGNLESAKVVAKGGASDCDDDYAGLVIAVDATHVYWTAGPPNIRSADSMDLLLLRACKW